MKLMKMTQQCIAIQVILGVLAMPLLGADILHSTLKDGMGIRALGMGNAVTAYAEGTKALYYNPSGLAFSGAHYQYENLDYKVEKKTHLLFDDIQHFLMRKYL